MARRQFNLRAIKDLRGQEQSRTRTWLAAFVDRVFPGADKSDQGDVADTIVETGPRREVSSASGPLSERLRQSAVQTLEEEPRSDSAHQVFLEDLDGNLMANLPTDGASDSIILGRGRNATVRISDPYVHRVHAHMRWDTATGTHIIVHGGGQNATYVNQRKIQAPYTLQDGNHIRLGRTEMIYRIG